jgi:hypothetical protein
MPATVAFMTSDQDIFPGNRLAGYFFIHRILVVKDNIPNI